VPHSSSGSSSSSSDGGGDSSSDSSKLRRSEPAAPARVSLGLGDEVARRASLGGTRPHQLFQQCNALRGEKAALERLNADLSKQVTAG
jgi:hypothetical protein